MKNVMNSVLVWAAVGALGSASAALVHQWSFNDDLLDTSGNGNDGTFTGTTETYVAGQFGNAISLAAGDAVDNLTATLGNATAANGDITINFWLNLDATADVASLAYIAGIGDRAAATSAARATINFDFGGDGRGFYNWGNANDADSSADYIYGGTWHMYTMAMDFDGAGNITYSFFIDGDGSFYAPVTVPRTMAATLDNVGVGGVSPYWNAQWAGAIDEFTVWDEALDSNAVSSLFTTNQIPEPSVMGLLGLGGLALLRRKRR